MKQAVEDRVHDAARRRGTDVIRGLLATVGIVGFVIGVPIALAAVAPIRVPSSAPSFDGVIDALSRPDDGSLLIGTLAVIAWLAWAAFALPVVVELIASLRGVRTPRLPLLGPAQRLAAGLVATAGLLMTAPQQPRLPDAAARRCGRPPRRRRRRHLPARGVCHDRLV